MRIVIIGNTGSGKTTLARELADRHDLAVLSLDDIAWNPGPEPQRRPLDQSLKALSDFTRDHRRWVIEGCYADLAETVLPRCTELIFLDPGTEVCVARCLARPWEPDKYETPEAQRAMLEPLIAWARQYDTRSDEFGRARHRALFDGFHGSKRCPGAGD